MTKQFLVSKHGVVIAQLSEQTTLKKVKASIVAIDDALNAEFPRALVGAYPFRVSSAKRYQDMHIDYNAKPLPGGRPDEFLIF